MRFLVAFTYCICLLCVVLFLLEAFKEYLKERCFLIATVLLLITLGIIFGGTLFAQYAFIEGYTIISNLMSNLIAKLL